MVTQASSHCPASCRPIISVHLSPAVCLRCVGTYVRPSAIDGVERATIRFSIVTVLGGLGHDPNRLHRVVYDSIFASGGKTRDAVTSGFSVIK